MSDAKHAPTLADIAPVRITTVGGQMVLVNKNGNRLTYVDDDARHLPAIVLACNSYDALVAMFDELLPDIEWGTVGRWKAGTPDNARLRAALKAAKGEA